LAEITAELNLLATSSFLIFRALFAAPGPLLCLHLGQCWGPTLSAQPTMAAVNRNMFDASVHADQIGNGSTAMVALPLNLVAHIVSYVSRAALHFQTRSFPDTDSACA
jgi:hypothetical protein